MKMKLYATLSLVAVAICGSVTAQRLDHAPGSLNTNTPQPSAFEETQTDPLESRGGGAVVWSEDFSNGLAGANPSGAWTVEGPNGNIWRIGTTAPRGAFTQNGERIQSTTFANGFAKFASDSANCTWSGTTPTALPVDQFTSWEGSLVSPIIDLSASPAVEIEFQQRSRWCCSESPFLLEISSDGGNTWPTSILSNEGNPINQGAAGSGTGPTITETRRFTMATAIAADPTNVRFRFRHNSEAGSSHYHWQIDDINIQNLPENDLRMNYAFVSTTGRGEEYGRIPSSQLPGTMNVGAEVFNYGGTDQTNVVMTCTVLNSNGDEVFSSVENIGNLASQATIVTDENPSLPALPNDLYTATFTLASDQIALDNTPDDNSRVRTFEITTDVYSFDNLGNHGPVAETSQQVGSGSFADNSENVKFLVMYDFIDTYTATGIEVVLGDQTAPGSSIIVSILDTTDVLSTPSVVNLPLTESDPYTITQEDIDNGIVGIPFLSSVELDPNSYYAVASLFSEGAAEVFILDDTTVPQPGFSSALWIPNDATNNQNFYGGNGTAWSVRLTSLFNVAVETRPALDGVTVYPNPSNGIVNISTSRAGKLFIDVMNIVGEVVMTNTFTGVTSMDLSGFASGVYTVRVSDGTNSSVHRVTLK